MRKYAKKRLRKTDVKRFKKMIENDRCRKEWRKTSDKRTNEPARSTETCAFPIMVYHVLIAGSIPFLVVRLCDPARSLPCASIDSDGPSPLEVALAFLFR